MPKINYIPNTMPGYSWDYGCWDIEIASHSEDKETTIFLMLHVEHCLKTTP